MKELIVYTCGVKRKVIDMKGIKMPDGWVYCLGCGQGPLTHYFRRYVNSTKLIVCKECLKKIG